MLSPGKKKRGVSTFKTDKYLKLDLLFLLYKFTKKKTYMLNKTIRN